MAAQLRCVETGTGGGTLHDEGYRLVADEVRSEVTVGRGERLRVELDLTNDGFAYPTNYRPMRFVLDNQIGGRVDYAGASRELAEQ